MMNYKTKDETEFIIEMSPEYKKALTEAFCDLVVFGEGYFRYPTDKDVIIRPKREEEE